MWKNAPCIVAMLYERRGEFDVQALNTRADRTVDIITKK